MEVRTCKNCGRIYNYIGRITPVCPICMKELEEKFEACRKYIKDNPGANIQKVADETGVSMKMIKQWVREERLTFAEGTLVGIECEGCGKNILTGRFCPQCKTQLTNRLNSVIKPEHGANAPGKQASAKMRFLDE